MITEEIIRPSALGVYFHRRETICKVVLKTEIDVGKRMWKKERKKDQEEACKVKEQFRRKGRHRKEGRTNFQKVFNKSEEKKCPVSQMID